MALCPCALLVVHQTGFQNRQHRHLKPGDAFCNWLTIRDWHGCGDGGRRVARAFCCLGIGKPIFYLPTPKVTCSAKHINFGVLNSAHRLYSELFLKGD